MKNEVGNVPDWCESALQIADQAIILDTGSDDGTQSAALAASKGAAVELYGSKHFDQDTKLGDFKFDVARNEALEKSTCDWNIAVDADERIVDIDPDFLEKLKKVPDHIDLLLCPVKMLDDNGNVTMDFLGERIFRNRPEIRYAGSMHNYVNVAQNKRQKVEWITVTSCRNKRTEKARAERHRQRFLMAEASFLPKIEKDPKDTRSMFYLARTYREDGQTAKSIPWYQRYLRTGGWSSERYQAALELAGCLMSLKDYDEAAKVLMLNIKYNWKRAEGYLTLGDICYAKEDWAQAAWWYQIAAGCEQPEGDMLFLKKVAYTFQPWDKLAMAYYHTREFDKAIVAVETALKFADAAPHKERLEKNLSIFKANLKPNPEKPRPKPKPKAKDITQASVSKSIGFFGPQLYKTLKLKPYEDPEQPALFYGCYPKAGDIEKIMAHKGLAVVVWTGSDGSFLMRKGNEAFLPLLQASHVKHVATSQFIAKDLERYGFKHRYLPIVVSDIQKFTPKPLGKKIYFYGAQDNRWLYGLDILEEVEDKLPEFEFIKLFSPLSDEDRQKDMEKVYEECFVTLLQTSKWRRNSLDTRICLSPNKSQNTSKCQMTG
jgi:tetratricopeptide (TPR) repeat protein